MALLAISAHGGIRLAEVGFVLMVIAGAALALVALMPVGGRIVNAIAGLALALGAVLLIIATHWGHFS